MKPVPKIFALTVASPTEKSTAHIGQKRSPSRPPDRQGSSRSARIISRSISSMPDWTQAGHDRFHDTGCGDPNGDPMALTSDGARQCRPPIHTSNTSHQPFRDTSRCLSRTQFHSRRPRYRRLSATRAGWLANYSTLAGTDPVLAVNRHRPPCPNDWAKGPTPSAWPRCQRDGSS